MNIKDSNKIKVPYDGKQNAKVGSTVTSKNSSESEISNLKDKQKKGNGKEKVDRKTVLSNLNNNSN